MCFCVLSPGREHHQGGQNGSAGDSELEVTAHRVPGPGSSSRETTGQGCVAGVAGVQRQGWSEGGWSQRGGSGGDLLCKNGCQLSVISGTGHSCIRVGLAGSKLGRLGHEGVISINRNQMLEELLVCLFVNEG